MNPVGPKDWLAGLPRHKQYARIVTFLLFVALVVLAFTGDCSCGGSARAAAPEIGDSLPDDLFLRCATKAINGVFGKLEPWQLAGYQRGLDVGAETKRAWVTTYFPEEGFPRGQETRWGYPVSERVVAANRLPARTFVWTPQSGIRQVLDTGARSNDARAERRGAQLWIDFWEPRKGSLFGDDNAGVQTVWVIERR